MLTRNRNPRYVRPVLSPSNLKWISEALPNLSSEIGGSVEFNKKGEFERYTVYTSSKRLAMILPDFFAVEWHAHFDPYAIQLPSLTDLRIAAKRKLGYDKKNMSVTGQLNIVFCLKGVVLYKFVGKKLHEKAIYERISAIMNEGADTVEGMNDQIRQIEKISNFQYELISWATALKRGVSLGRICLREFVSGPK